MPDGLGSPSPPPAFDAADRAQLAARGIAGAEAARQLARLARPAAWADLVRPCTPGDGIERLDAAAVAACEAAHAAAAAAGRVVAFVPASGAATRMFRELLAARALPGPLAPAAVAALAAAHPEARALREFAAALPRFAFADALARALAARGQDLERLRAEGPWRPLLEALLEPDGLDCARRPKALLPFHGRGADARTPVEEHLDAARALTGGGGPAARVHFTVAPGQREAFAAHLAALERRRPRGEVTLSEQSAATDTLAGAPGGGPFRDAGGRLLFRPAGHGALLPNLAACGGALAFVRNVDNVAVGAAAAAGDAWSRALTGHAAALADRAHALCARLDAGEPGAAGEAAAFLRATFGADAPGDPGALRAALDRPLRVCGMVANTGEPGGGPFWVRGADGAVTRQIVETSQVDPGSAAQQAILAGATHFNPVFLACALHDARGRPHDLARFVDPDAGIVTRRSHAGRELLALERPGLWNGAMARWNTVFVEVPLAVFNPVKSVFDLLRPAHQGP